MKWAAVTPTATVAKRAKECPIQMGTTAAKVTTGGKKRRYLKIVKARFGVFPCGSPLKATVVTLRKKASARITHKPTARSNCAAVAGSVSNSGGEIARNTTTAVRVITALQANAQMRAAENISSAVANRGGRPCTLRKIQFPCRLPDEVKATRNPAIVHNGTMPIAARSPAAATSRCTFPCATTNRKIVAATKDAPTLPYKTR